MPPDGWRKATLGGVAELVRGVSYPAQAASSERRESRLPLLRANNIGGGALDLADLLFVESRYAAASQHLRPGDCLIATSSGSRAVVGKAAFIDEAALDGVTTFGAFCTCVRTAGGSVRAEYLGEILQSSAYRQWTERESAGSAINNLSTSQLESFEFVLPSTDDQDEILRILRVSRASISNGQRAVAARERLEIGLRERLLEPEPDWSRAVIAEVASVSGGGTPPISVPACWGGDISWITPSDLTAEPGLYQHGSARTLTPLGLAASGAQMLPANTVLVTSRATIGEAKIAAAPVATNQGFQSLIPGTKVLPEFLLFWIKRHQADWVRQASGSTFLEIPRRRVEQLPITFPALETQRRICDVLLSAHRATTRAEAAVNASAASHLALRDELLTGKVRV